MRRKWVFIVPAAILGILLFIFIGGEVVRLLCNWLLPSLFGLREITFWQALGLLALARILVGGFGCHHSGRSHIRRHLKERWEHMTEEERERFRHGMCGHFGCAPSPSESKPE
jgi:hypothetical protein